MSDPTLQLIAPALIIASLTNPRKTFNAEKLAELAESVKASGVHSPVLVRPLPASRLEDTAGLAPRPAYELVTGERRLRASIMAAATSVPAIVRELTDGEAREIQVIENLQRADLSALEEAEGYEMLMQSGPNGTRLTADEVAAKIGKSRSYVYARLKLLDLIPQARTAMHEGKIDASKGLLLARIPTPELQAEALKVLTRADYHGEPMMGYRQAAEYVQNHFMLRLHDARFSKKDADLLPSAGACSVCPKRTGANPDLFADVKSADVCTDPKCYQAKDNAFAARQLEEAEARGQTIIQGKEARALMPNNYTSRVEGYLRLDDKADSPTDKPLRSVLSKQLVAENVQPVLIENPHKKGDLIAVLPAEKVAELLKMKGDAKGAKKIEDNAKYAEQHEAELAKEKARQALENAWRWAVLEATWEKVQAESAGNSSGPKLDEVTRHMALKRTTNLNQDDAKKLAKLLNLGKVAPADGVRDWIRTTPNPGAAVLLLLMFDEVLYRTWKPEEGNVGLFLVAEAFGVDRAAIEAQTRANTRAAKASEKKPAKADPATPSAAQAGGVRGGKAQKGTKVKTSAAPAAKKPKTSPEEAMQGIAAAMQGAEEAAAPAAADPGAAEAAQGDEGAADDGRADQGGSDGDGTRWPPNMAWPFPKQREAA